MNRLKMNPVLAQSVAHLVFSAVIPQDTQPTHDTGELI